MNATAGVTRFRELLAQRLGWTFDDNDISRLDQALGERSAANGMTLVDYLNRLAARPWDPEVTELARVLSITETYFFRHGEQFRALREDVLPERVVARARDKNLQMLSVACSSGEEPYSLAIVAREACPGRDWLVSVTGLDANPDVLRKATAGRYSDWSMRETPEDLKHRWYRQADGGWLVSDDIRSLVRFQQYNVADEDPYLFPPGRYDVIFCRNLLMYLTEPVAAALIRRMTNALVPGGSLFLGSTDSLGSRPDGLESRHSHHTFYYRKPVAAPQQRVVAPAEPPPPARLSSEDAFDRAIALLRDERFGEAITVLTEHRPPQPDPRWSTLHGVLLAQAGRLGESAAVARSLVESAGLYADAHQLLGLCSEGTRDVKEAIAQYRLAAYLDPGFALARLRLGQLALRDGDPRGAVTELERALALLPGEDEERIALFGGGFGRIALTALCRSEIDACGARR